MSERVDETTDGAQPEPPSGLAAAPSGPEPLVRDHVRAPEVEPPPPPRRNWVGAFGGLSLLAIAGAAVLFDEPDPCAKVGDRFDALWDDARAESIGEAFVATGTPHADETWQRARERVDGWLAGWVRRREGLCHAQEALASGSSDDLDRQARCLHERAVTVETVLERWEAPDRALVLRTPDIVEQMAPLAACDDLAALRAPIPLPSDNETRTRVEALHDTLARVAALELTGAHEAGIAAVTDVVTQARALEYPPLLARALHLQSRLEYHGAREASFEHAREAYFEAIAGADDATAITVATAIAAEDRSTTPEALQRRTTWLRLADAGLRRLGDAPKARARWNTARGLVALDAGEYAEAVGSFEAAVDTIESLDGDRARGLIAPLGDLGRAHRALEHDEAALAAFERALDLRREFSGDDHPDTALVAFDVGGLRQRQGHLAEAREAFESAIATWRTFYGDEYPSIGLAQQNLGDNALQRGQPAEAVTSYQDAIRRLTGREGMAAHLGRAHRKLAEALDALGRPEEAERHLRTALSLRTAALGEDHAELAIDRAALAKHLVEHGRRDEAVPLLERALAAAVDTFGRDHELTREIEQLRASAGLSTPEQ